MIMKTRVVFLWLVLFIGDYARSKNGAFASATSFEEDVALTRQEKHALEQLKPRITPYLKNDYMKEDIYLIRWLRAHKLNIQETERALRQNLRWRKELKMDTILREDWSDMHEDFHSVLDTFDKEGRPVSVANLGTWDLRKGVLTGKSERMLRYTYKLMEESAQKVIELEHQGKNVTRWKSIFNLDSFNPIQHTCPRCLFNYVMFVTRFQENYPEFTDAVVLINAPASFQLVMDALRPILTSETRGMLKIFGTDKRQWMAYLDKEISRSQRRPELGGTRGD